VLHHKNSSCGAIGATRNVATRLVPSRQLPLASSTRVDTANRVGNRFAFCRSVPDTLCRERRTASLATRRRYCAAKNFAGGRADVCTRMLVERGSKSSFRRPRLVLSVRGETFLGCELSASLETRPFSVAWGRARMSC